MTYNDALQEKKSMQLSEYWKYVMFYYLSYNSPFSVIFVLYDLNTKIGTKKEKDGLIPCYYCAHISIHAD